MAVATTLEPISQADFGRPHAKHLLERAGFGATPAEMDAAIEAGLDATVDRLVHYEAVDDSALPQPEVDPDVIRPPTEEERRLARRAQASGDQAQLDAFRQERLRRQAEDRRMFRGLQKNWLERMVLTPRPLEEKLTLLWHSHFATSYRQVNDAYLVHQQIAAFRKLASDSFARLAAYIVRDPAMLKYLNNDRNIARTPNENLARELMELFTLGVGNYSEQDIREGARALTGYHVRDNDFLLNERAHDRNTKTILGVTDDLDGDAFVRILLRRDACLRFAAYKLYRHFVADVAEGADDWQPHEKALIDQMALMLRRHEYKLKPVLAALFRSRAFYDPAVVGQKIKSPVHLVVGTMRSTGAPLRGRDRLVDALGLMGQSLLAPPSVAGWDIGRSWINTSTLFVRQNTCAYIITGLDPARADWQRSDVRYDPMPLLNGVNAADPAAVANHLVDALLGEHVPSSRREPLIRFLKARDDGLTRDAMIALLTLITAMPEYQLC